MEFSKFECYEAVALFDSQTDKDRTDLLQFKKGDVIKVVSRHWADGWLMGCLGESEGIVHVKFLKSKNGEKKSEAAKKKGTSKRKKGEKRARRKVVAIFDFEPPEDRKDLLAFKKGDVITIYEEKVKDWFQGKLGEKEGLVPRQYFEEMKERAKKDVPGGPEESSEVSVEASTEKAGESVSNDNSDSGVKEEKDLNIHSVEKEKSEEVSLGEKPLFRGEVSFLSDLETQEINDNRLEPLQKVKLVPRPVQMASTTLNSEDKEKEEELPGIPHRKEFKEYFKSILSTSLKGSGYQKEDIKAIQEFIDSKPCLSVNTSHSSRFIVRPSSTSSLLFFN